MKKLFLGIMTLCLMASLIVPAAAKDFTDTKDHWAKEEIDRITELGIFKGTDETSFSPEAAMTRGMFVAVLGRTAQHMGLEVTAAADAVFEDVSDEQYYAPYVAWAKENGIVNGIDETHFSPDTEITREQMCAIMIRFLRSRDIDLTAYSGKAVEFGDRDKISAYAVDAVTIAYNMGLVRGMDTADGLCFVPEASASRAAVAVVESRMLDKLESGSTDKDTDNPSGVKTGGPESGNGDNGGGTGTAGAEKQDEAEIASYLKTMLDNYNSSEFVETTEEPVRDCMNILMESVNNALAAHDDGQPLTSDFVQTEYADKIDQVKSMYGAMTEGQQSEMANVAVRLESTEHLKAVFDFFGVNHS